MASVNKDTKCWWVLFVDPNGDRKQIRPGKGTNKATAEQIGRYVDLLVAHICSQGILDRQAAIWLGGIGDKLHAKLARAGLTESRLVAEPEREPVVEPSITLAAFLDEYVVTGITRKGEIASTNTLKNWAATRELLQECFDGSRPLDSFSLADGKTLRKWLERHKISVTRRTPTGRMNETSIRQRVGNAKAMFGHAVLEKFLPQNPFRNQVSVCSQMMTAKRTFPPTSSTK
ncbi:MAG: hypothetical protein ABGZ53_31325 [Fuerstiella sp.]